MRNLRRTAVTVGVAVLFTLFVALLIDFAYEEPKYSDYCKEDFRYAKPVIEPPKCDYEYGGDYQKCVEDGGVPRFENNESGCPVFDKCNFCNKEFDQARKYYTRNVFVIAGVIGLVAIFAGTLWRIEFLAGGLMFGGILLLFYATIRYFNDADKLVRVLIILAELLIVVWIGYKRLYLDEIKKKKLKKR
ncbi:MAG: hypothetical protein HYW24_03625 [Candidatus Aenigmarchaeota archaeon]|nr:hypothetical protein [Candidatus Aenigmarchaeota archaeon]